MDLEQPLYISKPHRRSKGQEYLIYADRLELRAKILFCTLRIPFTSIIEIAVRPKPKMADMLLRPIETWWSYNNDWAAFAPHIYLHRKGWPGRIRFVPENLDEFVNKCKELSPNLRLKE